jgi:signal transduction histidine kinase
VSDDGPSIPPDVRNKIFDPFFSGREAGRGLGLGLSKCWRIVSLHGGQIDCLSQPGHGTSFTLTLPLTKA